MNRLYLAILLFCVAAPPSAAGDPHAVEVIRGIVRSTPEPFCPVGCGDYFLEDTAGAFIVYLAGSAGSTGIYADLHVEVTGYRAGCGTCVTFYRTAPVVVLPPTAVETGDGVLPWTALLGRNYPNPFNPATTIPFTLTRPARVRITVYDALGRETARIAEADFLPGPQGVSWNAPGISSGVYFVELRAVPESGPPVVEKKPMLLLR